MAWVDAYGDDMNCDDLNPPPENNRPCLGQCISLREEYKNGNDNFLRATRRYCVTSPVNPNAYPNLYMDEEVAEMKPNFELCKTDHCNNRPYYADGVNAHVSTILLLFVSLLFA